MSDEATRLRLFKLFREGKSLTSAARLVGISRQAARVHAVKLEAEGALQRIPHANPLLFEAGPRAGDIEAELLRQPADRPGRSARQPVVTAREHRGGWKWSVLSGPKVEPPWARRWEASGVENRSMYTVWKGEKFRLWEARGRTVSLQVQPPVRWVVGQDAEASRERRRRECADVVRGFAREYGYTLQAALEEMAPLEWGIPVPGMKATGVPGEDAVWIDNSEGEAQPELESQEPGIVAAVAGLPAWSASVDEQLAALKAEYQAQRQVVARVLEVQRDGALLNREMIQAVAQGMVNAERPRPRDGYEPEVV